MPRACPGGLARGCTIAGMDPVFEPMGEHALLVRLGARIDTAVNDRVHALCRGLREAGLPQIEDLVPAYASVLVRLAPSTPASGVERMADCVRELLERMPMDAQAAGTVLHRIPVCYGDACGPDMAHVEAVTGLPRERVVELHAAAEYRVAMIGFAPGFAYLLGLDERLHVPRREQPRTRVPRGSVAIGGAQTGVYPAELPGGWQVIGRTHEVLFERADPCNPCRLAPGDRVRFEPVDEAAFDKLRAGTGT